MSYLIPDTKTRIYSSAVHVITSLLLDPETIYSRFGIVVQQSTDQYRVDLLIWGRYYIAVIIDKYITNGPSD